MSAVSDQNIELILNNLIKKKNLISLRIKKKDLNKFLVSLQKNNKLPRVKSIEIKPKYIVQTEEKLLSFKVFINSKKKAPKVFTRFFENQFRKEFSLMGVPMKISFISSSNPYSN
jgi:GTP-binding protein